MTMTGGRAGLGAGEPPYQLTPFVTDKAADERVYGSVREQEASMSGTTRQQASRVTAIFEKAALAFNLPRNATLEELATELGALGERYGGPPLYVDVRLPA
jgi:hypothetical protein